MSSVKATLVVGSYAGEIARLNDEECARKTLPAATFEKRAPGDRRANLELTRPSSRPTVAFELLRQRRPQRRLCPTSRCGRHISERLVSLVQQFVLISRVVLLLSHRTCVAAILLRWKEEYVLILFHVLVDTVASHPPVLDLLDTPGQGDGRSW